MPPEEGSIRTAIAIAVQAPDAGQQRHKRIETVVGGGEQARQRIDRTETGEAAGKARREIAKKASPDHDRGRTVCSFQ